MHRLLPQGTKGKCGFSDGWSVTQPGLTGTVVIASSNSTGEQDMAGLSGRKVAVLATDGVEQMELTERVKALKQASAEVVV